MMRNNSYRAAAALLLSVAAIAVVVCVFSSADNEAALQEVGFPARNMQAQMQRPMDFVAVERAAGMALDRDVSNFLMRRTSGTPRAASVMRKRMALANAKHKLAPMAQLVATKASNKKYYHDPVFPKKVKDFVFDGTPGDPAFAKWELHRHVGRRTAEVGAFLDSITDNAKGLEETASSSSGSSDNYYPRAPAGSLSWDDVADKVTESGILKKSSSAPLVPTAGSSGVPNARDNTVSDDGDIVRMKGAAGSEIDYSKARFAIPTMDNDNDGIKQGIGMRGGLSPKKSPGPRLAPVPAHSWSGAAHKIHIDSRGKGPGAGPGMVHQLVHDRLAAPGPSGAPIPGQVTDAIPAGSPGVRDPSFSKPNTATNLHDFDFKKTHDPAFEPEGTIAKNAKASMMETKATVPTVPSLPTAPVAPKAPAATKTAVDLAKKAMAEHAKKTATSTKIQQLRAATARKELKYKKAMALVSKTAKDVKN